MFPIVQHGSTNRASFVCGLPTAPTRLWPRPFIISRATPGVLLPCSRKTSLVQVLPSPLKTSGEPGESYLADAEYKLCSMSRY